MKIVATTLGETLGDFHSITLKLGYAAGIGITFLFFLVVLFAQLSSTISFCFGLRLFLPGLLGPPLMTF
jgi:uncharacterized membrane-anchored protein